MEQMNRAGFAGDLEPEKDESHGKEQDGQPLFTVTCSPYSPVFLVSLFSN
ncbi:hypothetical protein JQX09_20685 [Sulfitobacter pseudonitzschiae]|uniref:Uncharacterized protein n=1 Tax=Pseudosulfitobacter pseudonitzschiae TaxID=1402135 RepID=A0A9Q2RXC6_9RHOB|nr:hypothetical protein [Pseudosulfitobacter pseudonitzschiae]MBM2294347.1 hypothetical protein [Pseudosulfitobacter pseudonitzschiae]MBM2299272.1 hypothetical protein [Pseudosulfitobacter pseudonitzschiae]MBM2318874.1 hypothetical protein [Pseudosulfitobacter pseudonitzschiae]MBM2328458.1 hypothetical protein [Pseudosulfitobacter pseudonitzschiae]MBM2338089.1 hypothetical protein [Pseudosulfitobacter pseudonitzschiae]